MKIGYLDCFSGISGDMLLGALLDCGYPEEDLRGTVNLLGLEMVRLKVLRQHDQTISSLRVVVEAGPQPARKLEDIESLLTGAGLTESVTGICLKIFRALADAEAAVHGCGSRDIHFHEVGAADALVDVVGAVAGFQQLGIGRLVCSPLPMPGGWVSCEHGELPLPAPAVCELLRDIPVYGEKLSQELVTPTGAAIIRVLADDFGPLPPMRLTKTGYGAGARARVDSRPNLLRLIIGRSFSPREAQQVMVIETALDDWSPETWPHVAAELLEHGALDTILIPIQVKKGRPGFLLRITCDPAAGDNLKRILLSETSAIGLRYHREYRLTLPREQVIVKTRWGPVPAKRIESPHGPVIAPEFEDCRRLARERKLPLSEIYAEVRRCSEGIRHH